MTENKSINTRDIISSVANTGEVKGSISVNSVKNMTPEQRQTLAEAAQEIQELLDQLSETYPTTTVAEKSTVAAKAIEEIENLEVMFFSKRLRESNVFELPIVGELHLSQKA